MGRAPATEKPWERARIPRYRVHVQGLQVAMEQHPEGTWVRWEDLVRAQAGETEKAP